MGLWICDNKIVVYNYHKKARYTGSWTTDVGRSTADDKA